MTAYAMIKIVHASWTPTTRIFHWYYWFTSLCQLNLLQLQSSPLVTGSDLLKIKLFYLFSTHVEVVLILTVKAYCLLPTANAKSWLRFYQSVKNLCDLVGFAQNILKMQFFIILFCFGRFHHTDHRYGNLPRYRNLTSYGNSARRTTT